MNEKEKKAIKIVNSLKEWGKIHFIVKDRSYARLTYNEVYLLLNLIEKLQKENEKLKSKNKTLEELLQGNLYELYKYYKELAGSYQGNCISVQKVKDKIEELKKQDKEWTEELSEPDSNFKIIDRNLKRIKNQIEILQELIESEE